MSRSTFVYVSYIRTTPEKLWAALTDTERMKDYWFGCRAECDWKAGSPWKLIGPDDTVMDSGEIVEADPPRRLVIRWQNVFKPELAAEGPSLCTMLLEPSGAAVKLSITHSVDRDPSKMVAAVGGGWPKVISNLKSLLETGTVVMAEPYPASAGQNQS
jgi:uncharacterized protein YndB with AHSA1/START domain